MKRYLCMPNSSQTGTIRYGPITFVHDSTFAYQPTCGLCINIILLNNKLHSTFQVECSAKMKILEESLRSEVNQVILQMKGKVL